MAPRWMYTKTSGPLWLKNKLHSMSLKTLFYQKGIKFRLLHLADLQVKFQNDVAVANKLNWKTMVLVERWNNLVWNHCEYGYFWQSAVALQFPLFLKLLLYFSARYLLYVYDRCHKVCLSQVTSFAAQLFLWVSCCLLLSLFIKLHYVFDILDIFNIPELTGFLRM